MIEPPESKRADIDPETLAVLELAQRTITERRRSDARRLVARERPWLIACVALPFVLLAGTVLWPVGTLIDRLRGIVRGICDQQHNLTIAGTVLPLDARCSGIYAGFLVALGSMLSLRRHGAVELPRRLILVGAGLAILVMGLDGFNSLLAETNGFNVYVPHNALRLASGIGAGLALALVGIPIFNGIVRAPLHTDLQDASTLSETLGIVALAAFIGMLFWSGPGWLLAPLAIFSVLGAFAALTVLNTFIVALASGLHRRMILGTQLGRPATLGMILTVVELFSLAWLRGATEVARGL